MTPVDYVLIVFAGIVLVTTFKKIKGVKMPSKPLGIGISLILVIVAVIGSTTVYDGLAEFGQPASVTPDTSVCPEFKITPTVSTGNGVLNSAEDKCNVPYLANTSSHTIDEGDNTTWANTAISFLISPTNLEQGADNTATATVYYEVINPGQTVDSSSGTYYMVTKTSGRWNNIFTGSGTEYNSGSHTMTITSNVTVLLTVTTDTTGMSYVANTYSDQTIQVRFFNGCGWSETFDINYICTLSSAVAT